MFQASRQFQLKPNFRGSQGLRRRPLFHIYVDKTGGRTAWIDFVLKLLLLNAHDIIAVGRHNSQHLVSEFRQGRIGNLHGVEVQCHPGMLAAVPVISGKQALLNGNRDHLFEGVGIHSCGYIRRICVLGSDRTFAGG